MTAQKRAQEHLFSTQPASSPKVSPTSPISNLIRCLLKTYLPAEPIAWTVADVQEWLESKGMGEYRENFLSKQINGAQIIELDNRTLLALGVDHLVHRKKLLKDIMALHTIDFNDYGIKDDDNQTWKSKGASVLRYVLTSLD